MLGFDLDSAASLCVLFLSLSAFKPNSKTLAKLGLVDSLPFIELEIKKIIKCMPSRLSKSNLANSKVKLLIISKKY